MHSRFNQYRVFGQTCIDTTQRNKNKKTELSFLKLSHVYVIIYMLFVNVSHCNVHITMLYKNHDKKIKLSCEFSCKKWNYDIVFDSFHVITYCWALFFSVRVAAKFASVVMRAGHVVSAVYLFKQIIKLDLISRCRKVSWFPKSNSS